MTYFKNTQYEGSSEEEKIKIILNEIDTNDRIHHNALRKIIVDENHDMAKRTFDKYVKRLRDDGTIKIIPMNDNKLHYALPQNPLDSLNFDKDYKDFSKQLEKELKKLKKNYKKFSTYEKQTVMISSLSTVISAIVGLSLSNSISDSLTTTLTEKEITLRKSVKEHIDIIMKEDDAKIVFVLLYNLF